MDGQREESVEIDTELCYTLGKIPRSEIRPIMEEKKQLKLGWNCWRVSSWQLIVTAVLLAASIVAGVLGTANQSTDPEMDEVVLTWQDRELTNRDLAFYFWTECYYALSSGATLDPTVPLEDQMYDDTQTWQAYLSDRVEQTMVETLALVSSAEDEGYSMPEARQMELDLLPQQLEESASYYGFLKEDGTPDVDAYLGWSYGEGVDEASFLRYMSDAYLAAAYADELLGRTTFTDEEVAEYYTAFAEDYISQGILQTDDWAVKVRDILIVPESTQQSDWDAAMEQGTALLEQWQAAGATEDIFAAMAAATSMDTVTALGGGMREFISQEQTDAAIAAWCFDDARQPGDTTVLQAGDGCHVLYFCSRGEHPYWYEKALSDLRYEAYMSTLRSLTADGTWSSTRSAWVLRTPAEWTES